MVSSVRLDSVGESSSANDSSPSNVGLGDTDSQIQRAISYAFGALAGLGSPAIVALSYLGVFQGSVAPRDLRSEIVYSRLHEMVKKYGLQTLLQTFSVEELKQKFNREIEDPKTTFWSVLQTYDTEALLKQGIIDEAHFALLQELKQKADGYKNIDFPHQRRHVLTLFANKPYAFKAFIALDREYKSKMGKESLPQEVINLDAPVVPSVQIHLGLHLGYIDARVRKAVGFAFAALGAVATFGVFKISIAFAILPLIVTISSLYFASNVIDYRDEKTQQTLRAQFNKANFVDLYREHGLVNLLQVFRVDELKEKFNEEVRNPETTFWNVLRRYHLQGLHQAGIMTSQHLTLLTNLCRYSEGINLAVYPKKENWRVGIGLFSASNTSYQVHTAFTNEPEAFRMAEALDLAYKAQVKGML